MNAINYHLEQFFWGEQEDRDIVSNYTNFLVHDNCILDRYLPLVSNFRISLNNTLCRSRLLKYSCSLLYQSVLQRKLSKQDVCNKLLPGLRECWLAAPPGLAHPTAHTSRTHTHTRVVCMYISHLCKVFSIIL